MATPNQNRPARTYEKRFLTVLPTVFAVERKFGRAFTDLQILDGIAQNRVAFTVKTNDQEVVINNYDKTAITGKADANNRFGKLEEVIYVDTDVEYDAELATNRLLDITTVNNDFDFAIAEELIKAATAYTVDMNKKDGAFFSAEAKITEEIADFSDTETEKVLNKLSAQFAELEVAVDVTMYVIPELYSALVDSRLATTGKNSSVSIDENGLYWFKGFRIEQTPKKYFADGDVAYLVPDGVAIPFIGISLVRAMEDSKYAGTILQTLSKGGRFVLDDNKKAIAKVTLKEEIGG